MIFKQQRFLSILTIAVLGLSIQDTLAVSRSENQSQDWDFPWAEPIADETPAIQFPIEKKPQPVDATIKPLPAKPQAHTPSFFNWLKTKSHHTSPPMTQPPLKTANPAPQLNAQNNVEKIKPRQSFWQRLKSKAKRSSSITTHKAQELKTKPTTAARSLHHSQVTATKPQQQIKRINAPRTQPSFLQWLMIKTHTNKLAPAAKPIVVIPQTSTSAPVKIMTPKTTSTPPTLLQRMLKPLATEQSLIQSIKTARHQPSLNAMFEYNNFNYNSTSMGNSFKFEGHSNVYLLSANDARLTETLSGGVLIFRANTSLSSETFLTPSTLSTTDQTIQNNVIAGHLLKRYNQHLAFDVMSGYGTGKMQYSAAVTGISGSGYANAPLHNWFINLTAADIHNWDQFSLKSTFSVLHSQTEQAALTVNFAGVTALEVEALSNSATYLLENAELGYRWKDYLQPFVNGGLLQVVQFSNSRPVFTSLALIGTLPEFNLNQNGYRLGAGASIYYKQLALRLEQQYNQRGSVYHSNITIGKLTVGFD